MGCRVGFAVRRIGLGAGVGAITGDTDGGFAVVGAGVGSAGIIRNSDVGADVRLRLVG